MLCLALSICPSATAASRDGDITIATVEGVAGSSVTVPITIENNRGIMAITISITYDSSVLEYVNYTKGDILKDYMVVAHPTKNIIRFVSCETKDRTGDGTLIYLNFNISDSAKEGLSEIDINYSKGDFCNWNLERLMPSITPGGVRVVPPIVAEKPLILSKNATTVTLLERSGYEYSIDGINWNASPLFSGLMPNTEYTLLQRIKVSDSSFAVSEPLIVTTDSLEAQNLVNLRKGILGGVLNTALDYNADGHINIRDLVLIKKLLSEGDFYA